MTELVYVWAATYVWGWPTEELDEGLDWFCFVEYDKGKPWVEDV